MAIVGYARVSSEDQSLDIQIEQLTAAGCTKIYKEKKSGVDLKARGELAACLNYVREGDVLMVTRVDRMARSMSDFFKTIDHLKERGVAFKCLLQPEIDTTNDSPSGKALMGFMAVMAEFETAVRRERQREGIEAAKARGVYKTKPGTHANGKMSWASRMLKQGRTYAQVAEATGIDDSTLRRRFPGHGTMPQRAPKTRSRGVSSEIGIMEAKGWVPKKALELVEAEVESLQRDLEKPSLLSRFLNRT